MRRKQSLQNYSLDLEMTNLQDSPSEAGPSRRSSRSSTRMKSKLVESATGRKRKASPEISNANEEIPVQRRAPSSGRKVDCYCWICHELGEDQVCSSCPRVYHSKCLKRSNCFTSEGLCPECQIISVDGTELKSPILPSTLKRLLLSALGTKPLDESILERWPINHHENEKLRCKMDRSKLIDNLNQNWNTEQFHYTKTTEFFSDIKWIFHNCIIIYGNHNPITTSAKRFMNKMKEELRNIEACPECYENSISGDEDFFVRVCDAKHPLVWAKLKGYPYWPAKCLKVINGVADVRFFKTHDKGNIKVDKCYFLSRDSPDAFRKKEDFKEAMRELEEYLKNWELKFGPFKYAPNHKIFVPELSSEDGNNAKITKSTPNKRSRRSKHSSGKIRQLEETDNSLHVRDSTEERNDQRCCTPRTLCETPSPNSRRNSQTNYIQKENNVSEMDESNQISESVSDIEEVEIIREVSKSKSITIVPNLNFIDNSSSNQALPKKSICLRKYCIENSENRGETLSVCMTFSTDEDELLNSNEELRNEGNTLPDHPLLSVSSPRRAEGVNQMQNSFSLHNSTSEESDLEIVSSVSEATAVRTSNANIEMQISESITMNSHSNLGGLVQEDTNSLLPQTSSGNNVNSEANNPNSHSEFGVENIPPSTSSYSNVSITSPIRIVESGSVPIPEREIIIVDNSPFNEANAGGDSSDDVQICEGPQIPDQIPNFYFRRSTPYSSASTNATNVHENELTTICSEAANFLRTLISRAWALGHKHKSANEIQNLLKGMDHNFKIREEAMLKMCAEKDRECEAKLTDIRNTCEDLRKKLNETDLILLNTKRELAACETEHVSTLELARKEWEAEKKNEMNTLREKLLEEINETRQLSQDWISKNEFEEELAKRIQLKEKDFQAELTNKIHIKEKEFQAELNNKMKLYKQQMTKMIEIKDNAATMREIEMTEKIEMMEKEQVKTIEVVKRQEWCAKCLEKAKFRCCWNTSYCGQSCQRAHWQDHVRVCETVKDNLKAKGVAPVKDTKGATANKEIIGVTADQEKNRILTFVQPLTPNTNVTAAAQENPRELPQFLIHLESTPTNGCINGNAPPVSSVSPPIAPVLIPQQAGRTVVRAKIFHPSSSDSPNT